MLGMLVATAAGVLGLHALGASESTIVLGAIAPLLVGPYLIAKITLHYSAERHKR